LLERILSLMEERGVNAKKLTTSTGLNHSAITNWKNGQGKPSTEAIIKIADYFGVTTDWLLTGKEPQERLSNEKGYAIMEKRYINKQLAKEALNVCLKSCWSKREDDRGRILIDTSSPPTNESLIDIASNTGLSMETLEGYVEIIMEKEDCDDTLYPSKADFYPLASVLAAFDNPTVKRFMDALDFEEETVSLLKAN